MRRFEISPLSILLILLLIAILILLVPLLLLGIIGGALVSLGFSGGMILLLIVAILAGSFINIPVTKIKGARQPDCVFRNRFGRVCTIPDSNDTVIAVNVGGAVNVNQPTANAVGAGVLAVDAVFRGEAANAFCAVRPPGHHAEAAQAMGFPP